MKKLLLIACLSVMIFGCNLNPSKETRIQQLEAKMITTQHKIDVFQNKIQSLENTNRKLEKRISELENP